MNRSASRLIVTLLLVGATGVPAAVLCAHECGNVAAAEATTTEQHCHEPAEDGVRLSATAMDACAVLSFTEPATRERVTRTEGAAAVVGEVPLVSTLLVSLRPSRTVLSVSPPDRGISPGTLIPLRI